MDLSPGRPDETSRWPRAPVHRWRPVAVALAVRHPGTDRAFAGTGHADRLGPVTSVGAVPDTSVGAVLRPGRLPPSAETATGLGGSAPPPAERPRPSRTAG